MVSTDIISASFQGQPGCKIGSRWLMAGGVTTVKSASTTRRLAKGEILSLHHRHHTAEHRNLNSQALEGSHGR